MHRADPAAQVRRADRFCTVTYADSQERDQYACWVQYSPKQVTFLYSYSPEAIPGPVCSFACTKK